MKTYITNLPFTIQQQIPQKNYLNISQPHKISPRGLPKENLKLKQVYTHICYLFIWKRNMISDTLNTSLTTLKFVINSTRSKNEVATTCVNYFHEHSQGRNMDALCVWLPHVLTPVVPTMEVRAISSAIPAMRCRWCMVVSCPLNLQGVGQDHRLCSDHPAICVQTSPN